MTDLSSEMAAAGAKQRTLTDEGLKSVGLLAQEQLKVEAEIAELQSKLTVANENLRMLSEVKIPTALEEFGLSEVKLADGKKIIVKPYVSASITQENEAACFKWLRDNNFGDIIKRVVGVVFGKGDDKKADELQATLVKKGFDVNDKAGVHASTLKAFIKEQIEAGNTALPKELFKVYEGKKATIK